MTEQNIIDQACEILRKTNDGDGLAPHHLKLVELAVNGFVNEEGAAAFQELHASVLAGYVKPWFHEIENLTIDHTGYVRWKGQIVEHYSYPPGSLEESKAAATELARRCQILESRGEVPTNRNTIWKWED